MNVKYAKCRLYLPVGCEEHIDYGDWFGLRLRCIRMRFDLDVVIIGRFECLRIQVFGYKLRLFICPVHYVCLYL